MGRASCVLIGMLHSGWQIAQWKMLVGVDIHDLSPAPLCDLSLA